MPGFPPLAEWSLLRRWIEANQERQVGAHGRHDGAACPEASQEPRHNVERGAHADVALMVGEELPARARPRANSRSSEVFSASILLAAPSWAISFSASIMCTCSRWRHSSRMSALP